MGRNYWYSHTGGNEVEGPFHYEKDCHHLERSDGYARPIDESVVDELDEDVEERCGTCTPLEDESTSGSGDTSEGSDSTELQEGLGEPEGTDLE